MPERLSNAQCLRVVGQSLEHLPIHAFRLAKVDDDYVLSVRSLETKHATGFIAQIRRRLLGKRDPQIPTQTIFSRSQILFLDIQRQSERTSSNPTDQRNLSVVLRVLGDYFDRKKAEDFTIEWSPNEIHVNYGDSQERFTAEELYDLGVRMYLRRAGRSRS